MTNPLMGDPISRVTGKLRPLPPCPACNSRTGIAFANPGPCRINLTNGTFLVIFQERARGNAGLRVLDFTGLPIDDKTVFFNKNIDIHSQTISGSTVIQFRPGNPDLFAASAASLTVKIHWLYRFQFSSPQINPVIRIAKVSVLSLRTFIYEFYPPLA